MLDSVCLRDETFVSNLILLLRVEYDAVCLGLWIAYVMYKARERIESAEGFLVKKDMNALRKYSKVSVVNVSPFSASSHFFMMPGKACQQGT